MGNIADTDQYRSEKSNPDHDPNPNVQNPHPKTPIKNSKHSPKFNRG
jgi:hypothetical protein